MLPPTESSRLFSAFVLQAVRSRPETDDWKQQVFYAALGLNAEAARLLRMARVWTVEPLPSAADAVGLLLPFERQLALTCYQIDVQPACEPRALCAFARLEDSAHELVVHAGAISMDICNWLFRGEVVVGPSRDHVSSLCAARRCFFRMLGVEPELIWASVLGEGRAGGGEASQVTMNVSPPFAQVRWG